MCRRQNRPGMWLTTTDEALHPKGWYLADKTRPRQLRLCRIRWRYGWPTWATDRPRCYPVLLFWCRAGLPLLTPSQPAPHPERLSSLIQNKRVTPCPIAGTMNSSLIWCCTQLGAGCLRIIQHWQWCVIQQSNIDGLRLAAVRHHSTQWGVW